MKAIIEEHNKLSKQGKFNLHYYIIHVCTLLIILLLTLFTAKNIINLEIQNRRLEDRITRLERIYQIDKEIKNEE